MSEAKKWLNENDGYEYVTKSGHKLEEAKTHIRTLLADREALVLLVQDSCDAYWWRNREDMAAWQALSQELKDEIADLRKA